MSRVTDSAFSFSYICLVKYLVNSYYAAITVVLVKFLFQQTDRLVAIKCITKKNLTKSQSLLSKEIKILQVCSKIYLIFRV